MSARSQAIAAKVLKCSILFINFILRAGVLRVLNMLSICEMGVFFAIAMVQVFRKIVGLTDERLFTSVLLFFLFTNALSMNLMLPWFVIGFLSHRYIIIDRHV